MQTEQDMGTILERSRVSISRMSADDAEELSRLMTSVISSLSYYNDRAKKSEIAKVSPPLLVNSIKEDPDSVLVARVGPELVGFCQSRYDDGPVWLSWFGVHPKWRGRGITTAILNALEKTLPARNAHKIWCDCRTTNEESKAVLTHFGYSQICSVSNHWYGQDFILWEKLVL